MLRGRGADGLPTLVSDSAAAAFLESDRASYSLGLEQCLRSVRVGGRMAVDNAWSCGQLLDDRPGDRDVAAIPDLNDRTAADARLQTVIVALGHRLWVGTRVR